MAELIGIGIIILTALILYPYTKEKYAHKDKLPFDEKLLKFSQKVDYE